MSAPAPPARCDRCGHEISQAMTTDGWMYVRLDATGDDRYTCTDGGRHRPRLEPARVRGFRLY